LEFLRVSRNAWLVLAVLVCLVSSRVNAQTQAPAPIGQVFASDVSVKGSVQLAGTGLEISNGSAITAGDHAAVMRLTRGGELRVCPRTSVTVNSGRTGELMYSMSSGALEMDYDLPATADVLMTPDFRVLASGPAHARLAISVNAQGDTCLKNSSAAGAYVLISELLGSGIRRLEPGAELLFRGGHLSDAVGTDANCGCPPSAAVVRATDVASASPTPANSTAPPVAAVAAPTAAESKPSDVKVSVDAPFVFHGDAGAEPDPTKTLARVHMEHLPDIPLVIEPLAPQPAAPVLLQAAAGDVPPKPRQKKGFFGKLKSVLASFFGRG
jgi:hypothetical protein